MDGAGGKKVEEKKLKTSHSATEVAKGTEWLELIAGQWFVEEWCCALAKRGNRTKDCY